MKVTRSFSRILATTLNWVGWSGCEIAPADIVSPSAAGSTSMAFFCLPIPTPTISPRNAATCLDIIGRQAVIAIQNARLYQDLVEEKERMVEIHEEARKKLARDLHDGPTQSVAAMAMRLNITRRMMAKDIKGAS